MSSSRQSDPPPGFELEQTLRGHNGLITRIAWSNDGQRLASPSFDGTIRLWNISDPQACQILAGNPGRIWATAWSPDGCWIASGSSDRKLQGKLQGRLRVWSTETGECMEEFEDHADACFAVAWSPDGRILASGGSDRTIHLSNTNDWNRLQELQGHSGQINSLAWSPDGQTLASCSSDGTIRLWDVETGQTRKLTGHYADVHCVVWSPDGAILASASDDNTVCVWDAKTGLTLFILEGHTASVNSVAFSSDGTLLASKASDDTVRLWRYDRWQTTGSWQPISVLLEPTTKGMHFGLAFHPNAPVLATLGDADTAIRIWTLDSASLAEFTLESIAEYYKIAKVVLVGDSGVGKSGLGLVLSDHSFQATESNHGRHTWMLDSNNVEMEGGRREKREVLLWDLAGQPGYRLIHQLHFNEIAVALVVFDARNETDPFAGVVYWSHALRQAQRGSSVVAMQKFLVSARIDRGVVGASPERIKAIQQEYAFDHYFETSAKEAWNISELRNAIRGAIDWAKLPEVVSTELFQRIKLFLMNTKQSGLQLVEIETLFEMFKKQTQSNSKEHYNHFIACIELVENRDLIRRLSFGNQLLLQPELLDAYASAIINEAKSEPDGLGSVLEKRVLAAKFKMSEDERICNKAVEKLLLIATVEELLERELAFREQTDEGEILIFPSQFTRDWSEAPDPAGKSLIFEFEGAVLNAYATLAVRLTRSDTFKKQEMWKDAALYQAPGGGSCGIWLKIVEEGKAELTLLFRDSVSKEIQLVFENFVGNHLQRHAIPESIRRRRILKCPECNILFTEEQVNARRAKGLDFIRCIVCEDVEVSLLDEDTQFRRDRRSETPKIDQAADAQRELETARSIIQGKQEARDFDVFLSYNNRNKSDAEVIAELLRQRGVNPWLDSEQIPPGTFVQEAIEAGIFSTKAGAVLIGLEDLGRVQRIELQMLNQQRIDRGIPVIPVLLQGVNQVPKELLWLRQLNWVKFESVDDLEALDKLVQGIRRNR